MSWEAWNAVDDYIVAQLIGDDPELVATLGRNAVEGLPAIDVSAAQGKFLALLVQISGAKRVLEVGTLGGYSTILLARAVGEGGHVTTIELRPEYAKVAVENITVAGLKERVDVQVGPALELLDAMVAVPPEPFDFTFIDADKKRSPDYFERAAKLSRPGAVIVVDNVVRNGSLADPEADDPDTLGNRRLHEQLRDMPGVDATTIQTVGTKAWDGFTIARLAD